MKETKSEIYPTVIACQWSIPAADHHEQCQIKNTLCRLIENLRTMLFQKGCFLIGHIKILVQNDHNEAVFCSLTNFNEAPNCSGEMHHLSENITLTANVIIYGVSAKDTRALAEKTVSTHFPQATVINCEIPHEHHKHHHHTDH